MCAQQRAAWRSSVRRVSDPLVAAAELRAPRVTLTLLPLLDLADGLLDRLAHCLETGGNPWDQPTRVLGVDAPRGIKPQLPGSLEALGAPARDRVFVRRGQSRQHARLLDEL